jgi:transposase
LPDRQVLCGILYVLYTDIQWEYLPKELGFGSGMTCWRRLRDWNETAVDTGKVDVDGELAKLLQGE